VVPKVTVTSAESTLEVLVQYVVKSTGTQESQTFTNGGA
jgi:hypothetical protein